MTKSVPHRSCRNLWYRLQVELRLACGNLRQQLPGGFGPALEQVGRLDTIAGNGIHSQIDGDTPQDRWNVRYRQAIPATQSRIDLAGSLM